MSVSNLNVGANYACNGATVTFAINFDYVDAEEVLVYQYLLADGSKELLESPADYTIVGANVVLGAAPSASYAIRVMRETVIDQPMEYDNNAGFNAEDHEQALDHLARISQEIDDKQNKSIHLSHIQGSFDPELPVLEANCILLVNADGDGFTAGPTVDSIEDAGTSAAEAAASAAAAAASATAAALSAASANQALEDTEQVRTEAIGEIETLTATSIADITDLVNDSYAEIQELVLESIEDLNFAITTGQATITADLTVALTEIYEAQADALGSIAADVAAAEAAAAAAAASAASITATAGGGSFEWYAPMGQGAILGEVASLKAYLFSEGADNKLTGVLQRSVDLPTSPTQKTMLISWAGQTPTEVVRWTLTTTLYKPGEDMTTPVNQHVDSFEETVTTANGIMTTELDMSDISGQINSLDVEPGDTLVFELVRVEAVVGTDDSEDTYFIPSLTKPNMV